ncbi:unnamed protein product, partial [Mesorhabditis spiculigera]
MFGLQATISHADESSIKLPICEQPQGYVPASLWPDHRSFKRLRYDLELDSNFTTNTAAPLSSGIISSTPTDCSATLVPRHTTFRDSCRLLDKYDYGGDIPSRSPLPIQLLRLPAYPHGTWAAASIWIDKSAYQDFFKLHAPSSTTASTSIVPALLFFHQAGIQHGPLTTSSAKFITSAAAVVLNTATATTSRRCPDYSQQFRYDTNSRMQGFNTQALKLDFTRQEAPSSLFNQTSPFQTFKLQNNALWMECDESLLDEADTPARLHEPPAKLHAILRLMDHYLGRREPFNRQVHQFVRLLATSSKPPPHQSASDKSMLPL